MRECIIEKQLVDYVINNKENHYRLAFSYVKNVDDALDVIQESIYKAISTVDTLKNPGYLKTWFYKILVNTSLDLLRKRKKLVVVDDEVLLSLDSGTFDNCEDIDLQKALDNLPVQYRSVVVLRFFEDLKIEEIAAILDENVNTIKTRLYKSLKMLRIQMNN
ncbi:sigma-70 family RNA polymerase sigma factor [Sporomusa sp.]|uniref:sigma-70 family RNA polymerase sigma factor n=1 Tax=Sporomusa sp. TaxID=2078658 RepID=UPI002B9A77E7|nr:sigma-70 family RNA polymerase sigma factor [Sporomusa sp.]HWR44541.1 sigma-70 family RNA polymerase sigma factor [Sporomusa sp.]